MTDVSVVWPRWVQVSLLVGWVCVLAFLFANVEIQIEGAAGWAVNLPTWRIEQHWLLDVFWGGRAMTGYHAWIFPLIFAFFHVPAFMYGRWSWRLEIRAVACTMLFWIVEDAIWFVCNPAFGWARLTPVDVPWHKHWFLGLPTDYWTFTAVSAALFTWSFRQTPCVSSS